MENHKLQVAASPHITSGASTRKIMLAVIVALLPTLAATTMIFGLRALLLTAVTVAACVAFEALWCRLMKKPIPVGDLSAVVTGLILAFNLPPAFPLWMAVVGAFVSIVITKQLFGGLGFNFANPALVGRIVMQLSFTGPMIDYTFPSTYGGVDALATATPLIVAKNQALPMIDMMLGTHGGVLGETCAVTLLLGGLFLIVTRVISAAIPLFYIGGVFLFKFFLNLGSGASAAESAYESLTLVLAGGLLLGAFFMATDYVTSPYTLSGKVIFGLCLAVLTVSIREWATMPEGVSFSILLMNLLVPYINNLTRRRPMGVPKGRWKSGKGAA
ncbi:RnfABCDGE type electron transport complex subunit D [Ruminococcaceae bacterium OttesenSCG-928-I18]|nr:RnfABCDGE type electron transport complex subunit D [Ruminococcaceae bacterium OttesenSCG-928-I18]